MLGEGMPEDKKAQMMDEVRAFLIARQPVPRQGTTDDIAETAIFFASDRSSDLTGQIMCVDGGMLTGNPQPAEGLQEILRRYRGEVTEGVVLAGGHGSGAVWSSAGARRCR